MAGSHLRLAVIVERTGFRKPVIARSPATRRSIEFVGETNLWGFKALCFSGGDTGPLR